MYEDVELIVDRDFDVGILCDISCGVWEGNYSAFLQKEGLLNMISRTAVPSPSRL